MAASRTHPLTSQAVWTVLHKCISRSLDFDSRLCPAVALSEVTGALDTGVRKFVDALLTNELHANAHEILAQPGALGGCSLRDGRVPYMHAAYWSTWAAHRLDVRAVALRLGRRLHADPDAAFAADAAAGLRTAGIDVDGATFVFAAEAAAAYAAGPWVADRPVHQVFKYDSDAAEPAVGALAAVPSSLVSESELPDAQQHADVHFERGQRRRVLGRLLRGLDALRAAHTWSRLSADRKKIMLSSGGFGAGVVWNAIPTRPQWQFSSARWQTATRARLGFLRAPTGSTCQLPKGDEGEETVCGKVLDQHVVHPALCDAGATKLLPQGRRCLR